MSIRINREKCIGCTKCSNVCPGNLIYLDRDNKAFIKYENLCYGCTACMKECNCGAIEMYISEKIGGKGGSLILEKMGHSLKWTIKSVNGDEEIITNRNESNKY